MRNQRSWRILTEVDENTSTLKVSQVIGKVDSNGQPFYPYFVEEVTVVFMSDDKKTFETCKATADGQGNMILTKRGLADDKSGTQVASFKKDWLPGTYMFATMGASDLPSLEESNTWKGHQTFKGKVSVEGDFEVSGDFSMETEGDVEFKTTCGDMTFQDKNIGPVTLEQMVRPPLSGSAIVPISEEDREEIEDPDLNTAYMRHIDGTNIINKMNFNGCDYNIGAANIHELTEKEYLNKNDELLLADSEDSNMNKKIKAENIFLNLGDGSDGSCVISSDTIMEAKEYNFENFTINSGKKLCFCGNAIPVIRVKCSFDNQGEIYLQNIHLTKKTANIVSPLGIIKTIENIEGLSEIVEEFGGDGGEGKGTNQHGGAGGGIGESGCNGCDYSSNRLGGNGGTGTEYAGGGGGGGGSSCVYGCQATDGCNASGCTGGNGGNGGCYGGGGGGGGFGLCQGGNGGAGGGNCVGNGGNGGNSCCRGGNGGNAGGCGNGGNGGDGYLYGGNGGVGGCNGKGGDGGNGIMCQGGNGGCNTVGDGGNGGYSVYGYGGNGGAGGGNGAGGNGGYGCIKGGNGGSGGDYGSGCRGGDGGNGGQSYLQGGDGGKAGRGCLTNCRHKGGDGGDSKMGMYSLVVFGDCINAGIICGDGGNGGNGGDGNTYYCTSCEGGQGGNGGAGGDGGNAYLIYKTCGIDGCYYVQGGKGGNGGIGINGAKNGRDGMDGKDGEVILTNCFII